jgi:L-fucose isomerase
MKMKIGIRPTIDGRWGGVREGLELQTMTMAQNAKKLIESNLKYTDGTAVECVIADTTIGGGSEAAKCAEKFAKENVCATLSVTPCWCYGSETMDIDPLTIKAVWGFNGTERPGAVYLAAVMAAHAQKGLPAFAIYGSDVCDRDSDGMTEDVKKKILGWAKCAVAIGQMRNKSYINIGSVSMGIAGSICPSEFFSKYLGIRTEWVDMVEILRRIDFEIYDKEEYETARNWVKNNCRQGDENNAVKLSEKEYEEQWDFTVKMTLIISDIMYGNDKLAKKGFYEEALGRNAVLAGFQGQRMWTDYKPNADFCEAILSSSFDWNGKREQKLLATENDGLNGVAMLFGKLLTQISSVFADVRTYWSANAVERVTGWKPEGKAEDGFIHLINSGAAALDGNGACKDEKGNSVMKKWWEITQKDIDAMMKSTRWAPANRSYFRGGGYSSQYSTQGEMPITLVRVNMIEEMPVLQLAEGWTVDLPEKVNKTLLDRTDPTWPSTWFVPRLAEGNNAFKDVYSVMANWGANHGAFAYGHIGAELITLASMLRIPVSMHNIEDKEIFRPHSFAAFGTKDLESADYRACSKYGPLYR